MKNLIRTFEKSNHFQLRQRERGIDDYTLDKIFDPIEKKEYNKTYVVVNESFFLKKGLPLMNQKLVIVLKEKCIVTAYWISNIQFHDLKKLSIRQNADILKMN